MGQRGWRQRGRRRRRREEGKKALAAEEEDDDEEEEAIFDSGRTAADDGLFSDFEQEEAATATDEAEERPRAIVVVPAQAPLAVAEAEERPRAIVVVPAQAPLVQVNQGNGKERKRKQGIGEIGNDLGLWHGPNGPYLARYGTWPTCRVGRVFFPKGPCLVWPVWRCGPMGLGHAVPCQVRPSAHLYPSPHPTISSLSLPHRDVSTNPPVTDSPPQHDRSGSPGSLPPIETLAPTPLPFRSLRPLGTDSPPIQPNRMEQRASIRPSLADQKPFVLPFGSDRPNIGGEGGGFV